MSPLGLRWGKKGLARGKERGKKGGRCTLLLRGNINRGQEEIGKRKESGKFFLNNFRRWREGKGKKGNLATVEVSFPLWKERGDWKKEKMG